MSSRARTHGQDSTASIGISEGSAQIGVIGFWLLLVVAIMGALTPLARKVPAWAWWAPALLGISAVLVNAATPRFREPVDPFLIILAACALGTAWLALTGRLEPSAAPAPQDEPLLG